MGPSLPGVGWPIPAHADLPQGFAVDWAAGVRRFDGGRLVVGGTPVRVVRLSLEAEQVIRGFGTASSPLAPLRPVSLIRPLLDAGLLQPMPGTAILGREDVTVVIPVRDRATPLARLLSTIGSVDRVVVVDDGSLDGSAEVAASYGAEVIQRPEPGGPAVARNAGLDTVTGPLVAFIDSDVRLPDGWLEALLPHFNDPTVAVVAPRVMGALAGRTDLIARYETARSPQDMGDCSGYVRPGNRVSFLPAAVLVVRTEVAKGVGGFDEALPAGEDVDFIWRLVELGWRVWYESSTWAAHEARSRVRSVLAQRVSYGRSAAVLHLRHPGSVAPVAVSPWSAAVWGAVAAGYPLAGTAIGVLTLARLARRLRGSVRDAGQVAWTVAGLGHLAAARLFPAALTRTWLPLVLGAARIRRFRASLALSLLLPPLAHWLSHRPPVNPAGYALLYLGDDAAYCAGVWSGCWRRRTLGPLLPRLLRLRPIFDSGRQIAAAHGPRDPGGADRP